MSVRAATVVRCVAAASQPAFFAAAFFAAAFFAVGFLVDDFPARDLAAGFVAGFLAAGLALDALSVASALSFSSSCSTFFRRAFTPMGTSGLGGCPSQPWRREG